MLTAQNNMHSPAALAAPMTVLLIVKSIPKISCHQLNLVVQLPLLEA
jgi:hypothetical protein